MKRIYETEIEKRKKCPFHFTAFLSELKVENTYISEMTPLKCLCTCSTITPFSVIPFFFQVFDKAALYFLGLDQERNSVFIIAKNSRFKVFPQTTPATIL